MVIYDLAGNKIELWYTYTVDSSPPTIQFSYNDNAFLQSTTIIRITFSEPIRNCSFYFWDDINQKVFINTTTLDLRLISLGEGLHTIFVYAEDLLGNNQTDSYQCIIDNTPVGTPALSLSSGAVYSSDIEMVKCFFDEKPSLIIVNWNNGINVTMTILGGANLMLSIVEEAGLYYILIDLPTRNFKTHVLTIYLMDKAGNWISYEFSYFKIPSIREICPLLLIVTIFFITILYMKRENIGKYFQPVSLRSTKKSDIKTEKSQESSAKTIEEGEDRISYKLGNEMRKKSKKNSPENKYTDRKTKKKKRRS